MGYYNKLVPATVQYLNSIGVTQSLVMFCTNGDFYKFLHSDVEDLENCLSEYYADKKTGAYRSIMSACDEYDMLVYAIEHMLIDKVEMSTREALMYLMDIEREISFEDFKNTYETYIGKMRAQSYDDLFADTYGDIESVKFIIELDIIFNSILNFFDSPLNDKDFFNSVFAKLKW